MVWRHRWRLRFVLALHISVILIVCAGYVFFLFVANGDFDIHGTKFNTRSQVDSHKPKDFINTNRRSCPTLNVTRNRCYPHDFFESGPAHRWLNHVKGTQITLDLHSRFLWIDPGNGTGTCPLFMYYHIHKTGGGSMASHIPTNMIKYNSDLQRDLGSKRYDQLCQERMELVYKNQQQQNQNSEHPTIQVFTFLRDPLDRFLSSLGQVLKGPKGLLRDRFMPCYTKMTTKDLIECVLNKMEQRLSFLDDHFVPQSFELYIGLMGYNISVNVVDLSLLSMVIQQMGGAVDATHENSAVGRIQDFPHFDLNPSALTPSMQVRICRLYEADLLLLKEAGVTSTRCQI